MTMEFVIQKYDLLKRKGFPIYMGTWLLSGWHHVLVCSLCGGPHKESIRYNSRMTSRITTLRNKIKVTIRIISRLSCKTGKKEEKNNNVCLCRRK